MRNRATTPLSKAKVRQSWSKYNLYNLSRITPAPYRTKTFFQQKWSAKSMARSYHGEQIRESQWERMFSKRLRAVVPMNAQYLARNDGSLESAGRGSGLETGGRPPRPKTPIPFMQMTFAPLERRLDTAIFRALFASSARQAKQFVVHGAVKVNGKKMRFPGYLLNPGDMFQVEPERVMYATGAPKTSTQAKAASEGESEDLEQSEESKEEAETPAPEAEDIEPARDNGEILKDLLAQTKSILASPKDKLSANKKIDLRAFSQSVKKLLSSRNRDTILTDSLEAQFLELQNKLNIKRKGAESKASTSKPAEASAVTTKTADSETTIPTLAEATDSDSLDTSPVSETAETELSDAEFNSLYLALAEMNENPIDEAKPYATPWMPREYMSAFAFIPRYLEVNQNICAAVYLRHPVARPGYAEVPTPFSADTNGTAFAWYLRRG